MCHVFPLFFDNLLILSISAVIAQIFNPTVEFAIATGTPTNEANSEIGTLAAETKIRKC